MKFILMLHKSRMESLSLSYGKETDITTILHLISACRRLQRISLTGVKFEYRGYLKLLEIVTLTELHLYSNSCGKIEYPKRNLRDCNLRIMSVLSNSHRFKNWVGSGYFPPDLRVVMPRILSQKEYIDTEQSLDIASILTEYQPTPAVRHTACLTFYQPLLKYVSLPPVPVAQFYFSPPDMKPTIHHFYSGSAMNELILGDNGSKSNIYSSVVSIPFSHNCNILYLKEASHNITSLQMLFQSSLTGVQLQTIASKCPKLLHLDIRYSDGCLTDLSGLEKIALRCFGLQSLNIDTENVSLPINLDKLWQVIGEMKKLRVLMTSINFIPVRSSPSPLPTLRALTILYKDRSTDSTNPLKFTDHNFDFFTSMTSLNYFRFKSIPNIKIFSGIQKILTSFTQLTHLYIDKMVGSKLILPIDPLLYVNIEKFYLGCDDYIMSDELTRTLSKCQYLKVLALKIHDVKILALLTMFESLSTLLTFHLFSQSLFPNPLDGDIFERFLKDIAEGQQRTVDIKIRGNTFERMFNDIEEHQFNDHL